MEHINGCKYCSVDLSKHRFKYYIIMFIRHNMSLMSATPLKIKSHSQSYIYARWGHKMLRHARRVNDSGLCFWKHLRQRLSHQQNVYRYSSSFSFFKFIFIFQIHFHFWNHFQNIFNFWIYFQIGFNIRIDYQFVFKSNLVIDFWNFFLEKVLVSHPYDRVTYFCVG